MAFRAPDWGNSWVTEFHKIIHRNLGGAPRFYKRAIELIISGFSMTVSVASKADMEAFLSAVISAAGTGVTYTDFEGTVWSGYWVPDSIAVKRGRHKVFIGSGSAGDCVDCDYQVSFSFKGTHA